MILVLAGLSGVGKSTLANILAKKYSLTYLDGGDLMKDMAREVGLTPGGDDWWESADAMKFLEIRKKDVQFDKRLDQKLIKKAEELKNVIMTSWAVPWLYDKCIKIYIKGSFTTRVKRIAKRDNIEVKDAEGLVKKRDKTNIQHYKNIYGFDISKDLEPFDFVINSDFFNIEEIKEVLISIIDKIK